MEFETVYSSGALADISKVKQISSRICIRQVGRVHLMNVDETNCN